MFGLWRSRPLAESTSRPAGEADDWPLFIPHPLFRGGHAQTLIGAFLRGPKIPYQATARIIRLDDGDALVLHDDCPPDWQPGDRAALVVHGLAGCHQSPYAERLAKKLPSHRVRCFRLDQRGCGAGRALARRTYHAGRSGDVAPAVTEIASLCPGSPVTLVGFSLGGNLILKYLGELREQIASRSAGPGPGPVDSGFAVCPPIDLAASARFLRRPLNSFYDRYLVKLLLKQLAERRRLMPDALQVTWPRVPRGLVELDDWITAPLNGFASADEYYAVSSAGPLLARIDVPTQIVASLDDPLIPAEIFSKFSRSPSVRLRMTRHGGHLGFRSWAGRSAGATFDGHWLDARLVAEITALANSNR